MKTVLQVPISTSLKQTATQAATDQGFSSLQEAVRVFLTQLSSQHITIRWSETIKLSEKNSKKYDKMHQDFKSNKNVYSASSAQDLIDQLEEYDD